MEELSLIACKKINEFFTAREFQVLKLVTLGQSNTEIGTELIISSHTVKKHVHSILQKLCVVNRVQAAVKITRASLLTITAINPL